MSLGAKEWGTSLHRARDALGAAPRNRLLRSLLLVSPVAITSSQNATGRSQNITDEVSEDPTRVYPKKGDRNNIGTARDYPLCQHSFRPTPLTN